LLIVLAVSNKTFNFMKFFFNPKTCLVLAVAVTVSAMNIGLAQAQSSPSSALPAGIVPGTPPAEVVKLVQSGVDVGVIKSYIASAPGTFNLDADLVLTLTDTGVSTDVINAMMDHDRNLTAAAAVPVSMPVSEPAPEPVSSDASVVVTAPPAEVTVSDFDNTLTPYGSWVDVEGYGRCWRPTVVTYDTGWRPYCDRGQWVYTDCGWYWNSDYSWGITFHYGRWFQHPRMGWCWWPNTVWAPSWVSWRSCDDYCGWAPLPPFSEFRPGAGFFYRGVGVEVGFDFGLTADCFLFLSPDHFCDRHPRSFCLDRGRVPDVFRRSGVINHFDTHDRFMVNRGISVDRFNAGGHRPIQPVAVGGLPNAGRQGFRGPITHGPGAGPGGAQPIRGGQNGGNLGRSPNAGQPGSTSSHAPVNHPSPGNQHSPVNQPVSGNQHSFGNQPAPGRPGNMGNTGNTGNTGNWGGSHPVNSPAQPVNQPGNSHPAVGAMAGHNQPAASSGGWGNSPGSSWGGSHSAATSSGATLVHAPAQNVAPVQHFSSPAVTHSPAAPVQQYSSPRSSGSSSSSPVMNSPRNSAPVQSSPQSSFSPGASQSSPSRGASQPGPSGGASQPGSSGGGNGGPHH
jgi:hypothetical protein